MIRILHLDASMKLNNLMVIIIAGLLTVYFSYSALYGQYGLFNKFRYESEQAVYLKKLTDVKSKNAALQIKVIRLSDSYLDLDLLDQQARKLLGLMRANEIIIQFN